MRRLIDCVGRTNHWSWGQPFAIVGREWGQGLTTVAATHGLDIGLADLNVSQGSDSNLADRGLEFTQSIIDWSANRTTGSPLSSKGLLPTVKQIEEDDSERSTCQHTLEGDSPPILPEDVGLA